MDTRLRSLLHDLATEMPVDVEGSAPPTLRKARGRRVLTAGAGAAIVVTLVVASASVLSLGSEPSPAPAVTGPNPATFAGLWPETDPQALAETQAAVDEGHQPMRTTAQGTATLFATDLLGWRYEGNMISSYDTHGGEGEVVLTNPMFGDDVGVIVVDLRQLGITGPDGAWSVVAVSEPPLSYPPVIRLDEVTEVATGTLRVSGRVDDLYDGVPAVEAHVFDGPALEPSLGAARYELTDQTFAFEVEVGPTPDGRATLLLTMPDAAGESLGAALVSVPTPVGAQEPEATVNVDGVPPDVAVTAQRIYEGATAHDLDALAPLLDPNTFAYNFDDGSDPIPTWREDPSVLDLMVAVLELPPAVPREIEGYGTLTIWPYLIDTDFDVLTERERADLASLGYSQQEIRLMIEGGFGYQGPRLAIDETGLWRSFTTMGE
jgi:hypothetical protein